MKVEVMIYIYGAVCAAMIAFNIVYNLVLRGSEPRMERRCQKFRDSMDQQLAEIRAGRPVEEAYMEDLRRRLCRVANLMAFHRVLQENLTRDPEACREYMRQTRPVILYLAFAYRQKEYMQAGYFAYVLSCYTAERQMAMDSIQDILLDYVKKPNLYCRFNALKALYHFASPEHIVQALRLQDDGGVFFHEKLITEGLLSYTGDHEALIAKLWEEFPSYTVHTQHAILNYIRFCSGNYKHEMYAILEDPTADKELRLAAVRYFGKYCYDPARAWLLKFVLDKDATRWEYATVAAASLTAYPDGEAIGALKEALHSGNWYVRNAAAQSLEQMQVDYTDVLDIAAGSDRYAREMMLYRLESRKLQGQEVAVP
jgi:hypothetical protein